MKNLKKIFLLVIILFLSNCTHKNKVVKLKTTEELYNIAVNDFKNKHFKIAAETFQKIEEQSPFTLYANKSIIMAAYSYYRAGMFDDSLLLIEYFKKINFDNQNLEYIYYLEILNKFSTIIKNNKKDLIKINETLKNVEDFIFIYPNSKYTTDLKKKYNELNEYALKNELKIAKFYINNNNFIGALNHLNNALNNYPTSKSTPEVIYRLYNLYKHIDYKNEYEKYYNILKNNYQDTKWFEYAKKNK